MDEAWAALEAELLSGWEIYELVQRRGQWRVNLAGPFISFRRDQAERATYEGPDGRTPVEALNAMRAAYVAWKDFTGG